MPDTQKFNEPKFTELILHVAARLREDSTFGATKLNKVMYYADFIYFAAHRQSITGATYRKLNYGPVPKDLPLVQRKLIEQGAAKMEENTRLGLIQKRLVPLRDADMTAFAESELAVINDVINFLEGKTAGEVSELSHLEPGWRLATIFEDIPYETVFLIDPTLTDDDILWGQKLAAERLSA